MSDKVCSGLRTSSLRVDRRTVISATKYGGKQFILHLGLWGLIFGPTPPQKKQKTKRKKKMDRNIRLGKFIVTQ